MIKSRRDLRSKTPKCICLEDNKLTQALCPVHGQYQGNKTPKFKTLTQKEAYQLAMDIKASHEKAWAEYYAATAVTPQAKLPEELFLQNRKLFLAKLWQHLEDDEDSKANNLLEKYVNSQILHSNRELIGRIKNLPTVTFKPVNGFSNIEYICLSSLLKLEEELG